MALSRKLLPPESQAARCQQLFVRSGYVSLCAAVIIAVLILILISAIARASPTTAPNVNPNPALNISRQNLFPCTFAKATLVSEPLAFSPSVRVRPVYAVTMNTEDAPRQALTYQLLRLIESECTDEGNDISNVINDND